jgi:hypothetical protein
VDSVVKRDISIDLLAAQKVLPMLNENALNSSFGSSVRLLA